EHDIPAEELGRLSQEPSGLDIAVLDPACKLLPVLLVRMNDRVSDVSGDSGTALPGFSFERSHLQERLKITGNPERDAAVMQQQLQLVAGGELFKFVSLHDRLPIDEFHPGQHLEGYLTKGDGAFGAT